LKNELSIVPDRPPEVDGEYEVFVQVVPQQRWVEGHVGEQAEGIIGPPSVPPMSVGGAVHAPLMQIWPAPQTTPHAPQLLGSVATRTQRVVPSGWRQLRSKLLGQEAGRSPVPRSSPQATSKKPAASATAAPANRKDTGDFIGNPSARGGSSAARK
jgi:hypothetical protein